MSRIPKIVNARGEKFVLTLLKIEERDMLGRPTQTRLVYDEERLEEVMNNRERESHRVEFLLVYVGAEMIKPQTKGEA